MLRAVVRRAASLWRNVRHRDRLDRELDDELQATLQLLVDERVSQGMDHGEARRHALMQFNGIEPVKERVRDIRTGVQFERLWQDAGARRRTANGRRCDRA